MGKVEIDTVREVTGLELDRAEALYAAFVTGDWSQVSNDALLIPPLPRETRETLWLEKGYKAELKRQLIASIAIERSRREAVDSWEEFLKTDQD